MSNVEQSDWRKRYHVPWFLKLEGFSIDFSDTEIERLPENVKESIIGDFMRFVNTENTQNINGQLINLRDIPQKMDLFVPHWVMDKLKEAMKLYVEGMYFAVIMLCGSIVEFIVDGMFEAFIETLPKDQRIKADSVMKNLVKLNNNGILNEDDYKKLCNVRKKRDEHTHLKVLRKDPIKLQNDALNSIIELTTFFDENNMTSNYQEYLKYLFDYSRS